MVDFWVDDADATAARAREAGGSVVVEPFEMPMGKSAVLADPAGAVFSVTWMAAAHPQG
jgi:predicted enzyme related to lactoylglutathione lyase